MTETELLAEYQSRYQELNGLAEKLIDFLTEMLEDTPRIDRIAARAKSPERFLGKALKLNDDGSIKYSSPFVQIQDQIGARVIVFYKQDVDAVSEVVDKYLRRIEERVVIPDSAKEFGYVGKHFILALPEDVISDQLDREKVPQFFELQVKTLFQHAWGEAEHDISYKSKEPLTKLQKRQVAFTAAQAWGADEIFEQLVNALT
ncbi:GTP pyrophosphokinase [Propionivibrio dicarboxylicus]|uniref:PpGpp synthetase catalytic domain-containing protein (RelA/SpoT-type nucleotidyltranferase) n=1 Tax=Propionivibrio dicarboxylicus TaxID=83767 RepID=A0A1G7Z6Z4_9RHOO|nr:RelA/SpoT domain-containing protein [Propionivibrio dicarboxylicus]SDH03890.1 ppGpp synthetase catalytic domain-containing protein (RelA/SpoT-type nucleotidyltranferase) [Propionivibrio dicarboxylicus]